MSDLLKLEDFPYQDYDKLRYGDMDMLGHVNNAVYVSLLETGRAGLLNHKGIEAWTSKSLTFVIARLEIDYRAEVRWPGLIHVGTAVKSVGNTSIVLQQALFSGEICAVTALNVMVQVDLRTHRPVAVSAERRAILEGLMLKGPGAAPEGHTPPP